MKKIYIIDDDMGMIESMSIVLQKNNYEVSYQTDDKNIEKNLLDKKPDLVILDVMFPEDSSAGFKIAREIKNNKQLLNIPIIMLSAINERGIYTGKFSDRDKDETWLPVNMFLEKPFNPKDLVQRIHTLIGK